MRALLGLTAGLVVVMVLGCGNDGAPGGSDAAPLDEVDAAYDDGALPPPLQWQALGDVALGLDGRTLPIVATLPAGRRFVVIRALPASEPSAMSDLCLALEDVGHGGANAGDDARVSYDAWKPIAADVCGSCAWPTRLGHGYGQWVLPSGPAPLVPGKLRFRVLLRRCSTSGMYSRLAGDAAPPHVSVAIAHGPEVSPGAEGLVRVRVAVDPKATEQARRADKDTVWAAAWQRASSLLGPAGIRLHVEHVRELVRDSPDPLVYDRSMRADLDLVSSDARFLLDQHASHAYVPVVVVPCLKASAGAASSAPVAGTTARIPGADGLWGLADAVFINDGLCRPDVPGGFTDPVALGNLLAHEIGHFLGLFHTDTGDGAARLPTDPPGGVTPDTLMNAHPLELASPTLTPEQRAVLRRHPVVGFAP